MRTRRGHCTRRFRIGALVWFVIAVASLKDNITITIRTRYSCWELRDRSGVWRSGLVCQDCRSRRLWIQIISRWIIWKGLNRKREREREFWRKRQYDDLCVYVYTLFIYLLFAAEFMGNANREDVRFYWTASATALSCILWASKAVEYRREDILITAAKLCTKRYYEYVRGYSLTYTYAHIFLHT